MKKFILILFFACIAFSAISADFDIYDDLTLYNNDEYSSDSKLILHECVLTIKGNVTLADVNLEEDGQIKVETGILNITGVIEGGFESTVIIYDGAQLIGEGDDVEALVYKSINSFNQDLKIGWYTLCSPVDIAITGFTGVSGTYDLYYYRESDACWLSRWVSSNSSYFMKKIGTGYLFANEHGGTYSFTGALNNGETQTVKVYYSSSNESLKGFNLIGNPFTHDIYKGWKFNDHCGISNDYLASGYYRITGSGSWEVCTFNEPIRPCEGVLMKASKKLNSDDLYIFDSNNVPTREKKTDSPTKGEDNSTLKLSVSGNAGNDRAFVYFYDGIGLDKIDHLSETAPSLSIRYEDEKYAIAHVDKYCQELDVVFDNNQSGFFTLSVDAEKANLKYLHLIDNFEGEEIDLLKENSYKFWANGNENENRFKLIIMPESAANDEQVFAYISNGDIIITGVNSNATLQMFDVTGRLVGAEVISGTGNSINRVHKPHTAGVYVLRLIEDNNVKSQKIVVE